MPGKVERLIMKEEGPLGDRPLPLGGRGGVRAPRACAKPARGLVVDRALYNLALRPDGDRAAPRRG